MMSSKEKESVPQVGRAHKAKSYTASAVCPMDSGGGNLILTNRKAPVIRTATSDIEAHPSSERQATQSTSYSHQYTETDSTSQTIGGNQDEYSQFGPQMETSAGPSTNTGDNTTRNGRWSKQETRELIWCYLYCKQTSNDDYKTIYQLWRERNPNYLILMQRNC